MDSSTNNKPEGKEESKQFLKNIGGKLADEEEGNIKGNINLDGFTKKEEVK
jgi:hypothetical protein